MGKSSGLAMSPTKEGMRAKRRDKEKKESASTTPPSSSPASSLPSTTSRFVSARLSRIGQLTLSDERVCDLKKDRKEGEGEKTSWRGPT